MTSDKSPPPSPQEAGPVDKKISVDKDSAPTQTGIPSKNLEPVDNDADLILKMRHLLDLTPGELDDARIALLKERIANGYYAELATDPETIANLLRDLGLDG